MRKYSPAVAYEIAVHQTLELDSIKPRKIRKDNFKKRYNKLLKEDFK